MLQLASISFGAPSSKVFSTATLGRLTALEVCLTLLKERDHTLFKVSALACAPLFAGLKVQLFFKTVTKTRTQRLLGTSVGLRRPMRQMRCAGTPMRLELCIFNMLPDQPHLVSFFGTNSLCKQRRPHGLCRPNQPRQKVCATRIRN